VTNNTINNVINNTIDNTMENAIVKIEFREVTVWDRRIEGTKQKKLLFDDDISERD
jgi:hypothetical protein